MKKIFLFWFLTALFSYNEGCTKQDCPAKNCPSYSEEISWQNGSLKYGEYSLPSVDSLISCCEWRPDTLNIKGMCTLSRNGSNNDGVQLIVVENVLSGVFLRRGNWNGATHEGIKMGCDTVPFLKTYPYLKLSKIRPKYDVSYVGDINGLRVEATFQFNKYTNKINGVYVGQFELHNLEVWRL